MRLLVVYISQEREAVALLQRLSVPSVALATCGNEREPNDEIKQLIVDKRITEIGYVGVNAKIQKSIKQQFSIGGSFSLSTVLGGSITITEWISPPASHSGTPILSPTLAFRAAARAQPRLVFSENALARADRIAQELHEFAAESAKALAEFAKDPAAVGGKLKDFFSERKLNFAVNGPTVATYSVLSPNGQMIVASHKTEWHLKEGGRNVAAELAARIYFDTIQYAGVMLVGILRCSPHPESFTTKVVIPAALANLLGQ